jgi:two-component system, OmpR family, sensor histidine kinase TctE
MRMRTASLRQRLLLGILVPVLALLALNAAWQYQQALDAADTAYDRTLLASAKSIGELLAVQGEPGQLRLSATLPYSALEPFEADNRSRLYYRVSGFEGELVSGFDDLPAWKGQLPAQGPYAALVDFYDASYRGEPVRMAVLLQPVSGTAGQGMATIQVAETLELREALARRTLIDTLWRQALIVLVIATVVVAVVQHATRPVRELSEQLARRPEGDLAPIDTRGAPTELSPLVDATNQVMSRLRDLLASQKRFVRDASHQLRSPLAVLKVQVQSARRGDVAAPLALAEIERTVERATELANQMLALAKVEQLVEDARGPAASEQAAVPLVDWSDVAREVALELAPLMVERDLDFEIRTEPAWVRSHAWPLRELTRNLLHNAIRFSVDGQPLTLTLRHAAPDRTELCVQDQGPGLDDEQARRLFTPFASARPPQRLRGEASTSGSGLGLVICQGIVQSLGGELRLVNRVDDQGRRIGLDAVAVLPALASPPAVQATSTPPAAHQASQPVDPALHRHAA